MDAAIDATIDAATVIRRAAADAAVVAIAGVCKSENLNILDSGTLEIWNPTSTKKIILGMNIRRAQNICRVPISRKQILLTLLGTIFSMFILWDGNLQKLLIVDLFSLVGH